MECQMWVGHFTGKGKLLLLNKRFWALWVLGHGWTERTTIAAWMKQFDPACDGDRIYTAISKRMLKG